jgi:transcriptional regulator with XRE-family HTH domain
MSARPRFKSEGQRLLVEKALSIVEVAKRVGLGKSAVGDWRTGRRVPNAAARRSLAREFEIPETTWTQRPKRSKPAPATEDLAGAGEVDEPDDELDDEEPAPVDSVAAAEHHLQRARRARVRAEKNGTAAELRGALDGERRAIELRAKLRGDLDAAAEAKFMQSALWKRIEAAIAAALKAHPEAAAAVEAALKELEA